MRCPKCHLIIAEYQVTCPECGEDLSSLAEALGPFYEPHPEAFSDLLSLEEDLNQVDLLEEDLDLGLPKTDDLLAPEEDKVKEEETPSEEISLEKVFGDEVLDEEDTKPLEASQEGSTTKGVEVEPLEEIEEIDLNHLFEEGDTSEDTEILEEIPDLEELLPPELQEAQGKD